MKDIVILEDSTRFSKVEEALNKMYKRQMEFCQTRSKFQIEKFIACEEYSDITKFRSISHNSYIAMQEVRRMIIERERKLREIKEKEKTKPLNYDLDIYEINRQLDDIELRIKGLLQEVDYMEEICKELEKKNGKPFTYEQFENEEPEYWQKRLANQMHVSQIGMQTGIGEGNYKSYLMGLEQSILNDNKEITPFNITDLNAIATVALKDRERINDTCLQENGTSRITK